VALSKVLEAAQLAEVCLIGETHDDPVAHQLELYLLVQMQSRRPCLLSLEMFETDVQPIVDEYLAGLIREDDLLQDARPWTNYSKDYRQMVEFCKGQAMPVSAANVPRRYVGAIGRDANALLEGAWPAARCPRGRPPLQRPVPARGCPPHPSARQERPRRVGGLEKGALLHAHTR
jgi:uncharacterized iron-regulated protein